MFLCRKKAALHYFFYKRNTLYINNLDPRRKNSPSGENLINFQVNMLRIEVMFLIRHEYSVIDFSLPLI